MSRKGEITVHQPYIYKHLEDKFQDVLEMKWREEERKATLSTPSFRLMRVKEGKGVLTQQEQTLYRCGLGILLYLVKQTRLDLVNATRGVKSHGHGKLCALEGIVESHQVCPEESGKGHCPQA